MEETVELPEGFEIQSQNYKNLPQGFEVETLQDIDNTQFKTVDEVSIATDDWLSKIATPDKIDEWKSKGAIDMIEAYKRLDKWEIIPYLNAKTVPEDLRVVKLMNRAVNNEDLTDIEKKDLSDFLTDYSEIQARGYTLGGKFVNAGLQTLPYMVETGVALASAGIGSVALAKTGAKVGVKAGIKAGVETLLKKAPKYIATTSALMLPQTARNYAQRKINDSIGVTDKGQLYIKEADEKPSTTLMKAYFDTQIETGVEAFGGMALRPLTTGVKKGVSKVLPKVVQEGLDQLGRTTIGRGVSSLIAKKDKIGFNGFLEELGEERISDLLKTAFNLDEQERTTLEQFRQAVFPGWENMLVEAGVIGIQGVGSNVAVGLANKLRSKGVSETDVLNIHETTTELEKEQMLQKFVEQDKIGIDKFLLNEQNRADYDIVYNQALKEVAGKLDIDKAETYANLVSSNAYAMSKLYDMNIKDYYSLKRPSVNIRESLKKVQEIKAPKIKKEVEQPAKVQEEKAQERFTQDELNYLYNSYTQANEILRKTKKPKSLLQFIKEEGGIYDPQGDLKQIINRKAYPFLLRKSKSIDIQTAQGTSKKSVTIDDVAKRVWDAGYFPGFTERPTVNDLINLIDHEVRGQKVYSELAIEDTQEIQQAKDILQEIDELGIDFTNVLKQDMKGQIDLNTNVITLFETADASTVFHELGHYFVNELQKAIKLTDNPQAKQDWQALKDTYGFIENGTTEQNRDAVEEMARGFETYLMEGKAPTNVLKTAFENLKQWLTEIYQSIASLGTNINNDVRRTFDNMLGAEKVTLAQQELTNKDISQIYQDNIKLQEDLGKNTVFGNIKRKTIETVQRIEDIYNATFLPIETVAYKVNPILQTKFREYTFNLLRIKKTDEDIIVPFIKKAQKLSENDFYTLDLALKNRDDETARRILKKYNFEEDFNKVRILLEDIYNKAKDVGLDIGYLENYYPRLVDSKKTIALLEYIEKLANQEEVDIKNQVLNPSEAKYSLIKKELDQHPTWTAEDKAQYINSTIRGFGKNNILLSRIGQLKYTREIDVLTSELNAFYKPFTEALPYYVGNARQNIESKKFFGGERQDVKDLRTKIKRKRLTILKMQNENKDVSIKQQELQELIKQLDIIKDEKLEDSIGYFIKDLVEKGQIFAEQEKTVRKLLMAKFNQQETGAFWGTIRDIGYLGTLNDFGNTSTQFGDLALAFYENGFYNSIAGIVASKKITKKDLGLESIVEEMNTKGMLSNSVKYIYKAIGFELVDNFGKNALINGAIIKAKRTLQKNSNALDEEFNFLFKEEAEQVKKDILEGKNTDGALFYAFNKLADAQPISTDQLPELYSQGGFYRVAYMLKTYSLKLFDILRRDIFMQLKEEPVKAIQNLIKLQIFLLAFGVPKDFLTDLLFGRETSLPESVVDNLIIFQLFNKYNITKGQKEGYGEVVKDFIVPPTFDIASTISQETTQVIKGKKEAEEMYSLNYVPIVGRPLYWWYGKGKERKKKEKRKVEKENKRFIEKIKDLFK